MYPASTLLQSPSLSATDAFSAARSTHPRVTLQDIHSAIWHTAFFTAGEAQAALSIQAGYDGRAWPQALDRLTICIVTMRNGFTVIGKSAPASPENFDAEKGRTFAYEDAVRQIWPLMGYALRESLSTT